MLDYAIKLSQNGMSENETRRSILIHDYWTKPLRRIRLVGSLGAATGQAQPARNPGITVATWRT
jgi:hypothetical protein